MDLATKLKCYRKMFNLNQADVADTVGVDRSTYAFYETGKSLPTQTTLQALADLFSIPAGYLQADEDESEAPYVFEPLTPLVLADSEFDRFKEEQLPLPETIPDSTDLSFPDLTADEKRLIIEYRIKNGRYNQV